MRAAMVAPCLKSAVMRAYRILIVLAGVMGADGVILAAASAHQPRCIAAGIGS